MQYMEVPLSIELYTYPTKSFTDVLEMLDPTEQYRGTPLEILDAYERQLKRYNIRVCGPGVMTVDKFFQSRETLILLPEYIRRSFKRDLSEIEIIELGSLLKNFQPITDEFSEEEI